MKKLLLIMLITICSMSATFGQQVFPSTQPNINLTAGTLDGYFTYAELNAITELTITGEINATDLLCIQGARLTFPYATKIDLSQANIVEYKGKLQYEPSYASDKTYYANAYVNAMGNTSQYHTFLTTFNIPNSTTEIVQHSLSHFQFNYRFVYGGCMSAMREFTIPKNVTKIGYQIFVYSYRDNVLDTCTLTSLTTKILDPRLCTTHIWAFEGVNKISCTLHVPYGTSALYRATAPWNQFQTIVEDGVPTLIDFTGNVATAGTLYTLLPISELRRNIKSITITGFYNEDDIAFVQNVFPETVIFNTSGATLLSKMPLTVDVEEAGTISTLFTSAQLTSTTKLTITGYFTQDDVDYVKTHLPNLVSLLCDDMWGAGGYSYHICNAVVGNLQAIVTGDKYIPAAITNLYVSGKINQADLDYIEANFTNLTILDTSKATFFGIPTDITTHEENKISIYPNPCTNGFTIREAISEIGNYQLINSSGVTVKNVVGGEYVDVSDLAKGIYFVRGVGENEAVCFKVVKR